MAAASRQECIDLKVAVVMHKLIAPGKPRHAKNHWCIGMQVAALRTHSWDVSIDKLVPWALWWRCRRPRLTSQWRSSTACTVLIAGV
jgi:hypothetical protein